MKRYAIAIVLLFSCGDGAVTWRGIPDKRQCSSFEGDLAVCVAEGREYTCVAEDTQGCGYRPKGIVECSESHGTAKQVMQRVRERHDREAQQQQQQTMLMMSN